MFNKVIKYKETDWHYRAYLKWRRVSTSKRYNYRENLCHYWRVVLIWWPLWWFFRVPRVRKMTPFNISYYIFVLLAFYLFSGPIIATLTIIGLIAFFMATMWFGKHVWPIIRPGFVWYFTAQKWKIVRPWSVTLTLGILGIYLRWGLMPLMIIGAIIGIFFLVVVVVVALILLWDFLGDLPQEPIRIRKPNISFTGVKRVASAPVRVVKAVNEYKKGSRICPWIELPTD